MKSTTLAIVLGTALWGTAAVAGSQETGGHNAMFDRLDRNGDDVVSKQEAERSPTVSRRFDRLDTDGNGKLTRQEVAQGPKAETSGGGQSSSNY